ncbi:GntR family transcriptional regulator [Streptomyces rimosus]|uniref:GntR family transcriptional regulator n=1 Tax=Streptomyces rimosus TaxID=1927 RepID=UPI0031D913DC
MDDSMQRPGALYQQLAAEMRSSIASGELKPGTPLPSEAQLVDRYRVSRPTVRKAVSLLKAEGLIEVIHGKGSYVKAVPAPPLTIERTVTRKGKTFTTPQGIWEQITPPTVYRTRTTAVTGPPLGLPEDEELFACDRVLRHPKTGTRALHRTLIPFATADIAPSLAEAPDASPTDIYAALTAAGHKLTWTETVRARMPLADERSALELPDATPVVHLLAVTHGTDLQPLLLEELRTNGHQAQFAFRVTADSPRALHSVPD